VCSRRYTNARNDSAGGVSTKTVKFTGKYNEDAHRLLADNNPPLYTTAFASSVGCQYMVVMEYMSSAKTLHRFFVPPLLRLSPLPDPDTVRRYLTKALGLLHEQDFVFGDLRPLNVLYSQEDNRAFLIDFDWVGKHEVDGYSTCFNTGGPGFGVRS